MSYPTEDGNGSMKMVEFTFTMEDLPGSSGALIQMEDFSSGGMGTIVYFSSADCSIEEGRVEAAGRKIHKNKMSIAEQSFMSLCWDPEGNMFGLNR